MSRFEDADQFTIDMVYQVINDNMEFNNLVDAKIKVLFDQKKKMSGGRYVLGRIQKANDLIRTLTANPNDDLADGYDYILYLDLAVWDSIDDTDKKRIIFHELNHCDVNFDKPNPYGIKDHEINGFYSELEYNKDDTRWLERLSTVAESLYNMD